jgi:uncharacterized lipoprotein YddW (UPF0748 family)
VVHVEKEMVREGLMRRLKLVEASLLVFALLTSCSVMETTPTTSSLLRTCAVDSRVPECPPASPREFRAVWIATVANIDWPTKPALSAAQQQGEAIAILNRVQALNMNAVLLQVRPSADAIYSSTLEPWAEWLTGEQGRTPGYDPLAFWIAEAKKRGIEVHAWFNPYRARHTKAVSQISKDHIANRLPNAVKSYGGFLWLDPGEKAAQDHSFAVIMDVVKRYDIDGVHFDDYFYPYPVVEQSASQQLAGQNTVANALNNNAPATSAAPTTVTRTPEREIDFPDEPSWKHYVASGGKLARADWRRDNVNRFVERVYRGIKAEKPWVRFGISPFGIGRPDRRPPGIVGFSQYDKLYADVELWLQRGWLDYLAPQLYWPIDQTPQAFAVLLDYWHAQNTAKRDIFPGLYTSRIDDTPRSWETKEIENQIALVRAKRNVAQGHVHFSMAPIAQNRRNLQTSLASMYQEPAINVFSPLNEANETKNDNIDIAIEIAKSQYNVGFRLRSSSPISTQLLRGVALHLRYGERWQFALLPIVAVSAPDAAIAETTVPLSSKDGVLNAVAVSLIDRYARESVRRVRDVRELAP